MSAPATFATATLVKHATADGLCTVRQSVPLGKIYRVDLGSVREARLFNIDRQCFHVKSVINAVDTDGRSLAWFALELLRIEES